MSVFLFWRGERALSADCDGSKAGEIHLGQGFEAGAGEQVALHQADTHLPQADHLFAGLDPLRQRGDLQLRKQRQTVAHDGLPGRVLVDAAQQVHIELDDIWQKIGQQVETRVTGAKVIHRRLEAKRLIVIDDAANMLVIQQLLHLGQLEHDLLDGEVVLAGGLQGGADAALRAVDRIGQKIDAQHPLHPESGRQRDGLDAAQLIEAIAIAVVDPGNHRVRRFVVEPPHQRLIAEEGAVAAIDDGLEGHGEIEVEIHLLLTLLADGLGGGGRYIHNVPHKGDVGAELWLK